MDSKLNPTVADHWEWCVRRNPSLRNLSAENLEKSRRLFFAGAGAVVGISFQISQGKFAEDPNVIWDSVCKEIEKFYQEEAQSVADTLGCSLDDVQRLHKQREDAIGRGEHDPWIKPDLP